MKFRIDFVTNSSSSGHLVLTMYFKNGDKMSGEFSSPADGWYMGDENIEKDIASLKSPAELMRYLYKSFLSELKPGMDYCSIPVRPMDAMNDYSDLAAIEVKEKIEYEWATYYGAFYSVASKKAVPKTEAKKYRQKPPFEPYTGPDINVDSAKRPLSWIEAQHYPALSPKRKAEITKDIDSAKSLSQECAVRVLKNYISPCRRAIEEVVGEGSNSHALTFFLLTRVLSIVGSSGKATYDLLSRSFPSPSFPDFSQWESMIGEVSDAMKTNYLDNLALSKLLGYPAKMLYKCSVLLTSRMDSCSDGVYAVLNAYRDLF